MLKYRACAYKDWAHKSKEPFSHDAAHIRDELIGYDNNRFWVMMGRSFSWSLMHLPLQNHSCTYVWQKQWDKKYFRYKIIALRQCILCFLCWLLRSLVGLEYQVCGTLFFIACWNCVCFLTLFFLYFSGRLQSLAYTYFILHYEDGVAYDIRSAPRL